MCPMKRVAAAAVVLLAACGGSSRNAPDAAAFANADGGIDGKLSVRASPGRGTFVMLGDGTRFLGQPNADGWVVFEDPALKGPQTVSVVTVEGADYTDAGVPETSGSGRPSVTTYLAFDRDVLETYYPATPPQSMPKIGRLEGTISSCGDGHVGISVFGPGLWAGNNGRVPCGSYGFDLLAEKEGARPGPFTVVVQNSNWDWDVSLGALQDPRVGMVTGVTLPESGIVHLDLTLDHPCDQVTEVDVTGLPSGGVPLSAGVQYFLGDEYAA